MATSETEVLIVGAGPTGLTLANILGMHGVRAVLVERNAATVGEPRAVSIDDESLRTMQYIDLIDAVRGITFPLKANASPRSCRTSWSTAMRGGPHFGNLSSKRNSGKG
jgi:2-polyprenyl-6-methoxyphenol hydroxylase-like FAD-dependent oxidoreductase